jgi:two-component system chemotaxis response regulator CheY
MGNSVLVVDDDELVRLTLAELLATEGFAVTTAVDGDQALRIAAGTRHDLVLLDVVMPGMTGFEVCRALRALAEYRDVPIVMLTAKSREPDRRKGLEAGATHFLPKPVHPARLLETIRGAIGGAGG